MSQRAELEYYRPHAKVLLVDDHLEDTHIAKAILLGLNCAVDIARSGEEALRLIESEKYDLIVLDWSMPILDGGDTLRMLEGRCEDGRVTPVVIHSGMDPNHIELPWTKKFQFVEFWSKPTGIREVSNRARWILRRIKKEREQE